MSLNPCLDPHCPDPDKVDSIETLIVPRARDIGIFEVRRALPSTKRQMVGPFIFSDQVRPVEFLTDKGIDMRPHPHIGLATVAYLFDGKMYYCDSLGTFIEIEPGAVNWMIAGHGIIHSERLGDGERAQHSTLFGIQTWVALPDEQEEVDPGFEHQRKEALPVIEGEGKQVRLILGHAYGEEAPVKTFSDMFYGDVMLGAGAKLPMPAGHEDRAIYVLEGTIDVAGDAFEPGWMMVFRPGDRITVTAKTAARIMILGGETLGRSRHIWWNFVASSKERIEAAKQAWAEGDWEHGGFQLPPMTRTSSSLCPIGKTGPRAPLRDERMGDHLPVGPPTRARPSARVWRTMRVRRAWVHVPWSGGRWRKATLGAWVPRAAQ